ncbi:ligase-associated DNA damage response endonuclease PdeM [Sphingosinicella sp. LHD-64]|uniref:ligase-associated DNA damage response endonuclease PdeM n=1 Tax=Sphingosinicella sp. LHD-64 TaxID=3072139 RepID=UPI00281014A8|nr:ligase-associated DNA damage response endonuclease PdeM [Sphingosinicella sp. LHD-64]MDQ8757076.1 ligase-associated DNA damage response endonuclease PdeM [Sphingosinicella sp. LHD-64]
MVPFSFCGHKFEALSQGALFWPARSALLVADLHLEKASWFAKGGQMLPPYDSIATLTDLTRLVVGVGAGEIWCLGDSFHDSDGCDRLPVRAREILTGLTAATRWTWIVGNHDPMMGLRCPGDSATPSFTDTCGGVIVDEAEIDGLILRHEAVPGESRPELSGHFHPKLRISHRGRMVSRRCFVATERKLILPAFGALTGGLDARHPEIGRAVGTGAEALVPVADRLLRFPLAA